MKVILLTDSLCRRKKKIDELICAFDRIDKTMPDIDFVKIDISKDLELATKRKVRATPIVFFEKDGDIVDSMGINGPDYLDDEQVLVDRIERNK